MPVALFGAPTSLPLGPALVAIESGAPTYGVSVRRRPGGRYAGRLDPLDDPRRRARAGEPGDRLPRGRGALVRAPGRLGPRAVVGGLLPDLAGPRSEDRADDRPARPGRPPHPHARLRRHVGDRRDPRPRARRPPTSTSSRSPTTSGSTPRWPPATSPATAELGSRSSSARRSRPGAATCWRCSSTSRSGPAARCARPSPRSTTRAGWRSRPTRSCPTRCAPRGSCCAACSPIPIRASTPTGSRRSTRRRSGGRSTPGSSQFAAEDGPGPARQQRRPRRRGDRHGLDHVPGAEAGRPAPAAIVARRTHAHGSFHGTGSQVSTFGRQLRKYGRDVRDEVRGRVRRDGTGRDHGYPGGRSRPPRYEPEPAAEAGR